MFSKTLLISYNRLKEPPARFHKRYPLDKKVDSKKMGFYMRIFNVLHDVIYLMNGLLQSVS